MKWVAPKHGDIKIERKFALFPIYIGYERRWLEMVNIKYKYYEYGCKKLSYGNGFYKLHGWYPEEFIDD